MISFIITCHNHMELLKCCLSSFLWQKSSCEYEIILIDNNSDQEDPNDVYQMFVTKLPLYLIKQPRLKHPFANAKARNIGLKISKYPWIVTLDADIVINPNYIETLIRTITENENAIITGERIFVSFFANKNEKTFYSQEIIEHFKPVRSVSNYFHVRDRRIEGLKEIANHQHPWGLMHSGNCIFPKDKALLIQAYDESYDGFWGYEDVDFAYRLIKLANCKPHYEPGLYCYHLENINCHRDQERFSKKNNPNWQRICNKIPGFKEFKENEYHKLSTLIAF